METRNQVSFTFTLYGHCFCINVITTGVESYQNKVVGAESYIRILHFDYAQLLATNISYEIHLRECGLTTLETGILRGDQIEVFKIFNGYKGIDRTFFSAKEERIGLENMKLC